MTNSPTTIDIRDWTIYQIANPAGRIYIGKTSNFKARMRQYKNIQLKRQDFIMRSIIKYGFANHQITTLDTFSGSGVEAESREMFWIRSYMSNVCRYPDQMGMNMTDGGEGVLGIKRSDEYKEVCRNRNIGRKNSDRQKLIASLTHVGKKWRLGAKHSQEEKDKRNEKLRGQKRTPEQILNYRKGQALIRGTAVIVTHINSGEAIEYCSIAEAARKIGTTRCYISRHLGYSLSGILPRIKSEYTFKYK